jgi:hypothetical protein
MPGGCYRCRPRRAARRCPPRCGAARARAAARWPAQRAAAPRPLTARPAPPCASAQVLDLGQVVAGARGRSRGPGRSALLRRAAAARVGFGLPPSESARAGARP